jgi:hypothetical protein
MATPLPTMPFSRNRHALKAIGAFMIGAAGAEFIFLAQEQHR